MSAREHLSLDGEWHFVRDASRRLNAASLPDGEPISVPGCWEAQVQYPFGIVHAWYWRDFEIPSTWPDDDFAVCFGAVMYRCQVWLDGRPIAEHEGGYTPFEAPLDGLRRGVRARLVLRVTNPMNAIEHYPALSAERLDEAEARMPDLPIREIPHGKQTWYGSQSGPWKSVSLVRRPSSHILGLRAFPDWSTGLVRVTAATSGDIDHGALEFIIAGPDGEVAGAAVPASAAVEHEIHVPDRIAWGIDAPNLYRLEARLTRDGESIDSTSVRFGFREVRTEGGRVVLNGRPILVRGALDQDLYDRTISTPPSRQMLDEQLRLAREMGLNLLRCHIKVPDPAYLDAADEAGMLLWCELPNWLRLTPASARRGESLLEELVDAAGAHPSVVIWTIINEDWGTDVRGSARDRRWLRRAAWRLRTRDPARLVVDNSPCPAPGGPNFHLDTDLADFHVYAAMPDAAARWRDQMAELAERPSWLWSPHGDAVRRGDEPVVVSEFGTWGLPDPSRLVDAWWRTTGDGAARPDGIEQRFDEQGLDRVWPDLAALCEGTQRLQAQALNYQVGEIRRHRGMAGFVVTEFTDANWEANGLLDLARSPKAGHHLLRQAFGSQSLIVDLPRYDLWSGEKVCARVTLSSDAAGSGGRLRWRMRSEEGSVPSEAWSAATASPLGQIEFTAPIVDGATDAQLHVWLDDMRGSTVADAWVSLAVLPRTPRTKAAASELAVTSRLDREGLDRVEAGGNVLLLARSSDAIPIGLELERPVRIAPRWPGRELADVDHTWTGDWISAFSWLTPELARGLPWRAPLDFAYAEVLPDHVLLGYEPERHADEVPAGMFVGWVHAPAALVWSFAHGAGRVTITTFHVTPDGGPIAVALFHALFTLAAGRLP